MCNEILFLTFADYDMFKWYSGELYRAIMEMSRSHTRLTHRGHPNGPLSGVTFRGHKEGIIYKIHDIL